MAKSTPAEETTHTVVDTAAVNEPTKHEFPTAQTEPAKADYAIATQELYVGGVRAHNVGDKVPTANVERNGWGDKVTSA